jgi:hypothetical protein
MEPPSSHIVSILEQTARGPIEETRVESAGVVGVKVMKSSQPECQFARTCCASLSSSYDWRQTRSSFSQLGDLLADLGLNLVMTYSKIAVNTCGMQIQLLNGIPESVLHER